MKKKLDTLTNVIIIVGGIAGYIMSLNGKTPYYVPWSIWIVCTLPAVLLYACRYIKRKEVGTLIGVVVGLLTIILEVICLIRGVALFD